ncbi:MULTISPECIES: hypothetical protein [Streptomyces]|uniref:Uncharacterized protein n=2 Tax=Streptomyces TaxID=1883 RepID=A0ABV9J9Y4_9ACTN
MAFIKDAGGTARLVECDVRDEKAVVDALQAAASGVSSLDFAVNGVGGSGGDKPQRRSTFRHAGMIACGGRGRAAARSSTSPPAPAPSVF